MLSLSQWPSGGAGAGQKRRLRLCEEAHPHSTPVQPGRWLVHTSTKAAIKAPCSTDCEPNEVRCVGRGVTGRDYHDAYQDISTRQEASSALDSKDFEADPVFQGSEGRGGEGAFFWGKYQLPLFHKGLSALLALCYTSSASLAAPSCVKFTQALKDCGIPKEIIFQSIEFLMEKPPWMLSYKLEDPLLSK